MKMVLDKPVKKIWNLQQLKIGECFTGIPHAEYYKNRKRNKFINLKLDAGYSTCNIFFLIFDWPEQNILNKRFKNSFELVKYYRECNWIQGNSEITQLHDINWKEILDWLNRGEIIKLKVINTDINGFKNIQFLKYY